MIIVNNHSENRLVVYNDKKQLHFDNYQGRVSAQLIFLIENEVPQCHLLIKCPVLGFGQHH